MKWIFHFENATAAVVGATGAIGRVCAELLAGEVGRLILIARDESRLEELRDPLTAVMHERVARQHKDGFFERGAVDPDGHQRDP